MSDKLLNFCFDKLSNNELNTLSNEVSKNVVEFKKRVLIATSDLNKYKIRRWLNSKKLAKLEEDALVLESSHKQLNSLHMIIIDQQNSRKNKDDIPESLNIPKSEQKHKFN